MADHIHSGCPCPVDNRIGPNFGRPMCNRQQTVARVEAKLLDDIRDRAEFAAQWRDQWADERGLPRQLVLAVRDVAQLVVEDVPALLALVVSLRAEGASAAAAARAEIENAAEEYTDLLRRYEEIVPPAARAAGKNRIAYVCGSCRNGSHLGCYWTRTDPHACACGCWPISTRTPEMEALVRAEYAKVKEVATDA